MSTNTSWLDALKVTLEEEPRRPREDSHEPRPSTMQKVQKPREEAGGEVVDIRTARAPRDGDERRLLAAGWRPKHGCGPLGITIWASPETGFYCSQEVALHRLDNPPPVSRTGERSHREAGATGRNSHRPIKTADLQEERATGRTGGEDDETALAGAETAAAAVVYVGDGYDVYIARKCKRGGWNLEASKWANPFKAPRDGSRHEIIEKYRRWITRGGGRHLLADLHELEGKRLGCWCAPKPCHGDVLLELLAERRRGRRRR